MIFNLSDAEKIENEVKNKLEKTNIKLKSKLETLLKEKYIAVINSETLFSKDPITSVEIALADRIVEISILQLEILSLLNDISTKIKNIIESETKFALNIKTDSKKEISKHMNLVIQNELSLITNKIMTDLSIDKKIEDIYTIIYSLDI